MTLLNLILQIHEQENHHATKFAGKIFREQQRKKKLSTYRLPTKFFCKKILVLYQLSIHVENDRKYRNFTKLHLTIETLNFLN